MHQTVFTAFDRLCRLHQSGGRVLEIGAMASADTLLDLPAIAGASERIGLNADPQDDIGGRIVTGNANAMTMFEAASFDLVLCNSMLEHDARFWLTLGEIRRVLHAGGIAIIGVPGYAAARSSGKRLASVASRLWTPKLPGGTTLAGFAASTPTLNVHNFPADYYRFSAQAVRDVFFRRLRRARHRGGDDAAADHRRRPQAVTAISHAPAALRPLGTDSDRGRHGSAGSSASHSRVHR